MARRTNKEIKDDKLTDVYEAARTDFDSAQSRQWETRKQCMNDRRFGSIAGAQWEGGYEKQFKNKPKLEANMIQLAVVRIYNEFRNNRITVEYQPADGSDADDMAQDLNDLYRAMENRSGAIESIDTSFDEGVMGGIGGYRFTYVDEDEYDPDNDNQIIKMIPIHDADVSVFFNNGAKRQDKKDAKKCWVLWSIPREEYVAEYDDDPSSWPKRTDTNQFDWQPKDDIYVAEYYHVEEGKDVLFTYEPLIGEDVIVKQSEIEDEEVEEDKLGKVETLLATGYVLTDERIIKTRQVHKYLMGGNGILEDYGIIPGKEIPVTLFYGKRWFIDGIERVMGHVRLPKDMQRLFNMQISELAIIASSGSQEKPIVAPEQVLGLEDEWAEDNINNTAYLRLNPLLDAQGNPIVPGPIGFTRPPMMPPAMSNLINLSSVTIQSLLGNPDNGERMASNISGDAIELVQKSLDMQTFIYVSNFAKAVQRGGEIFLSMVGDLYTQKGRKMRGLTQQGTTRPIEFMKEKQDEDGKTVVVNDFSKAKYEVVTTVGPTSSTRREGTVKRLTEMLKVTTDPQDAAILSAMIMMNMDGDGMGDFKDFYHDKLLMLGVVKPNDEEKAELAKQAENQQPDPQAELITSLAAEAQAKTGKLVQDTLQSEAKTENIKVDSAEKAASIDRDDRDQVISTIEKITE